MVKLEDLKGWVGQVGFVQPDPKQPTAVVAVKVVGVEWAYGRVLLVCKPLAGMGQWKVNAERVEFDRREELL